MKDIKEKIDKLNSIIDMNFKNNTLDDEQVKMYGLISEILEDLNGKVEKVLENEAVLAENFKYMDQDISGIQDELFEEVSVEDLEQMEETEYKEVKCKKCGKTIYIEQSALDNAEELKCPYCNEKIK